ncbi:putative membrane protein YdbT with pleckstrin-like domain [Chryseobacterium sp. BIGb0186]|nr:putative membrane protein YdbT with pleckstrin-like domain [Chryseobacterium sp. JUb44]MDH6210804.1 putative membrane protein YdbT with pleckstrin-like domain [Chryseobacterium sp. BIGb0186]
MNNLNKKFKSSSLVIITISILMTLLIAYSVSIKGKVEVNFYNFTFKASD